MLAIRLRVRPCRARCSPRLVGRSTVRTPSDCSTFISTESAWANSPLGPFTATRPGPTSTVTASGTGMGFLPIRLMIWSPDVGDDLAADALRLRFVACHHAYRGADDRRAGAAVHAGDLLVVDVAAAARARDALQAGDHRAAVLGVLEADLDRLAHGRRLLCKIDDVALLLEDSRHLHLQPRGGDVHGVVAGAKRVADPGQVIGYRVGQHRSSSLTSWTWSYRGCTPRERPRAGRCDRVRTCGSRRAAGHSGGNGCTPAICTWACAPASPSAKS